MTLTSKIDLGKLFPELKAELEKLDKIMAKEQGRIEVAEAKKQRIEEKMTNFENLIAEFLDEATQEIAKLQGEESTGEVISEHIQNNEAILEELDEKIAESMLKIAKARAMKRPISDQLKALEIPIVAPNYDTHDNWTISCQELDMPLDWRGRVKGWMESEPINDDWDGLNDNQLRILEDTEPERRAKYLS